MAVPIGCNFTIFFSFSNFFLASSLGFSLFSNFFAFFALLFDFIGKFKIMLKKASSLIAVLFIHPLSVSPVFEVPLAKKRNHAEEGSWAQQYELAKNARQSSNQIYRDRSIEV